MTLTCSLRLCCSAQASMTQTLACRAISSRNLLHSPSVMAFSWGYCRGKSHGTVTARPMQVTATSVACHQLPRGHGAAIVPYPHVPTPAPPLLDRQHPATMPPCPPCPPVGSRTHLLRTHGVDAVGEVAAEQREGDAVAQHRGLFHCRHKHPLHGARVETAGVGAEGQKKGAGRAGEGICLSGHTAPVPHVFCPCPHVRLYVTHPTLPNLPHR